MKTNMMTLLMVWSVISANAWAQEQAVVDSQQPVPQEVVASCQAELAGIANPEQYMDECIKETLQSDSE